MWRILSFLLAAAPLIALTSCSGGDDSPRTPTAVATTPDAATSTPEATPTSGPTPLPTVPAATLGLRAVEVASGRNVTLPVEFGRASAWSRDSSHVAVAGSGLAVGRTDGTPFRLFWPADCYGVEWSPTEDVVAAICKDVAALFDSSGRVITSTRVSSASFSSKVPLVAWSPDGKLVAYGPVDGAIQFLAPSGQAPGEIAGAFTGLQWLADGRLVSIEQPYYQSAAVVRLHETPNGFKVSAEFTTPAGAYGVGVDPKTGILAYGLYGASPGPDRVLPSEVIMVDLSTGRQLARHQDAYLAEYTSPPSFGPGGRLAAMAGFCKPESWTIDALSPDGTRSMVARGGAMRIKFSPDGRWLAFTRGITLWVAAVDGSSAPRQVANEVHGPAEFWWSPDSKWISVPPYFGGFDQCL